MGFVARPLNIARCGASFKVTDGHRLTGSDVGLYIYLRRLRATGLAVWSSFDIRLNLHLSLKMDDTGGGKRLRWQARIDAAETQLVIPEGGHRSSVERRGSSPGKQPSIRLRERWQSWARHSISARGDTTQALVLRWEPLWPLGALLAKATGAAWSGLDV